jgi:hypothetical protein
MINIIPYNLFEMAKHDYKPYLLEFFREFTIQMKSGFCLDQLKKLYDQKKKVKIGLGGHYSEFDGDIEDFYGHMSENDTEATIPIGDLRIKRTDKLYIIFIIVEDDKIQLLCYHSDGNNEVNDIIYECRFADLLSKNYDRILKRMFSNENIEIIKKIAK